MHESLSSIVYQDVPCWPETTLNNKRRRALNLRIQRNLQREEKILKKNRCCSLQPACNCQLSRNSRCIFTSSIFKHDNRGALYAQIPQHEITYLLSDGGNRCCAALCVCSACLIRRPRELSGYAWTQCCASESEHHAVGTRACQGNAHNTGDKAEERIF